MLEQTFSLSDIPRVGILAFLEILLSADNAIVLGVVSSALPQALRKKALYIGFLSAIFFRAIGIISIAFFLHFFWIQLLAATYLIYICLRHFIKTRKSRESLMPSPMPSFFKTVCLIELFDLAFAIDSITAGVALLQPTSGTGLHPKLWIVYVGGLVGVLFIRYAAHIFSVLIHRFSRLESSAYALMGWIGLKLGCNSISLTFSSFDFVFWVGLLILLGLGFTKIKQRED